MTAHKRLDPYGALLHLCFSEEEWRAEAKRFQFEDWEAGPDGAGRTDDTMDMKRSQYHLLVFIELGSHSEGYVLNSIVHESVHAAGMLFAHIGQEHDGMNEAYAYLVGYIAEWIHHQWRRTKEIK